MLLLPFALLVLPTGRLGEGPDFTPESVKFEGELDCVAEVNSEADQAEAILYYLAKQIGPLVQEGFLNQPWSLVIDVSGLLEIIKAQQLVEQPISLVLDRVRQEILGLLWLRQSAPQVEIKTAYEFGIGAWLGVDCQQPYRLSLRYRLTSP